MLVKDLPLVFFTLLTQISVGGFIVFQIINLISDKTSNQRKTAGNILWILIILSISGLFFAFLHLGHPLHAINALNNLSGSWMSREILFACLFIAILLFGLITQRDKPGSSKLSIFLTITGILTGLALIFSIAKIYMLPTLKEWHSAATMVEFFTCSILLGSFLVLAFTSEKKQALKFRHDVILLIIVLFYLVDMINKYLAPEVMDKLQSLSTIQVVLSLISLIILMVIIINFLQKKELKRSLIFMAFITEILSEIAGRILFYASYSSAGI